MFRVNANTVCVPRLAAIPSFCSLFICCKRKEEIKEEKRRKGGNVSYLKRKC